MYTSSLAITRPRCSGCGNPSGSHSSRTNETPTVRVQLCGDAHFQTRVAVLLHVLLPLGRAGISRLTVARIARAGRTSFCFASHGESLEQLSVQPHVELLLPSHALEIVLIVSLQAHLDHVFAVCRELVLDGDAAARTQREIFALTILLRDVQWNFEMSRLSALPAAIRGEARDVARDRHVAFEMRRGDRE